MMTLELRYSNARKTKLIFMAIPPILCGFWMTGIFGDIGQVKIVPRLIFNLANIFGTSPVNIIHALGYFCIIFFGFALLFFFSKNDRDIQVIVSEKGLFYRQWSSKTIEWNNIREISEIMIGNQKFLTIFLIDKSIDKPTTISSKISAIFYNYIYLNVSLFPISHAELVTELGRYKKLLGLK